MFVDESSANFVDPFENVLPAHSSYWKNSPHFTKLFLLRKHLFTYLFSVFIYFSELVNIKEYVIGNKQHRIINKVRKYHDEVEKAVADFLAPKLKENW